MSITAEQGQELFRAILNREPANPAEWASLSARCHSLAELCDQLLKSDEYITRFFHRHSADFFSGVRPGDLELMKHYARPSTPANGYYHTFLGCKTNIRYVKITSWMSGFVEGIPHVTPTFHEAIEFIGSLRAVETAKDQFVVMELGAGWGPWLVAGAVAARTKGISTIRMIAVEGDSGHVSYIPEHVTDNGFSLDQLTVHYGVVAARDGKAYFPIEGDNNWGAEAVFVSSTEELTPERMLPGLEPAHYKEVPAHSLATAFGAEPSIDLLHVDIQGAEYDVLSTAKQLLKERVTWMVIGTHSRMLEAKLFELFHAEGWILENEKPCKFDQAHNRLTTYLDGTQVWRNPVRAPAPDRG